MESNGSKTRKLLILLLDFPLDRLSARFSVQVLPRVLRSLNDL